MIEDLNRSFETAARLQASGDIVSAERKYREILAACAANGRNDAWLALAACVHFNLGILGVAAGQGDRGFIHLRCALESNFAQPSWWVSYATSLARFGRLDEAKEAAEQALAAGLDVALLERELLLSADLATKNAVAAVWMLAPYAAGSAGDDAARSQLAISSANNVPGLMAQLAAGGDWFTGGVQRIEAMGTDSESTAAKARLAELFNAYGSDKARTKKHNYHELYGYILRNPGSISAVLEIGLGTNNTDVVSHMSKYGRPGALAESLSRLSAARQYIRRRLR